MNNFVRYDQKCYVLDINQVEVEEIAVNYVRYETIWHYSYNFDLIFL